MSDRNRIRVTLPTAANPNDDDGLKLAWQTWCQRARLRHFTKTLANWKDWRSTTGFGLSGNCNAKDARSGNRLDIGQEPAADRKCCKRNRRIDTLWCLSVPAFSREAAVP
jgi:hypothetical protein